MDELQTIRTFRLFGIKRIPNYDLLAKLIEYRNKLNSLIIIMIMIMIMMMMMMMIIIIIIIELQGSIRDFFFYNLLTALRTVSNTYAQVAQAQSCANHVQHTERSSRATCRVPLGAKGQLRYYGWQSLNCIYFSFILLAETIN